MAKVVGIGGIFFKANDIKALESWYRNMLGIDIGEYGATFQPKNVPANGYTAFSLFKEKSEYFDVPDKPTQQTYMINFLVDDLDMLIVKLKENNVRLVGEPETHDYGKFAWCVDPEGNKIELWEPSK